MSLTVKNLSVILEGKEILKRVNLEIKPSKIHALMGPNGSGKSTLSQVLMGDEKYKLGNLHYELKLDGKNIKNLKTDERARKGLFLAFQNPIAVPGVSVAGLLRTVYQTKNKNGEKRTHNPALTVWQFNEMLISVSKKLKIPQEFLRRSLNEQFSGGEKKKLEMLQALVIVPKYAIFDEIDTGLDIDALKIVASAIGELKRSGTGVLLITHYLRILHYIKPDFVHILVNGEIVDSGHFKLAKEVEKNGYRKWTNPKV